jgi:phosphoglucomutase
MRDIQSLIRHWTSDAFDEATRKEIRQLVEANDTKELEDRFRCDLEFGTGGMRGLLGAGTNRMNIYTVCWAAQGLASYVKANAEKPGPLRAVIAHDCRHGAREFAEACAGVFAANGFIAHVFEELRPTPELSFAVLRLEAHTGIVITASHNPKQYNGFKAYWDDGSQVVPPHDKGIVREVKRVAESGEVQRMDFQQGVARGLIHVMGKEMDRLYLDAIRAQRLDADLIKRMADRFKIVFTPLHGTGGTLAPAALADWGFTRVFPVEKQMVPDGDFPTAKSPNPEEGAALEMGIELAREVGAELVLSTDPDADRLGIAVLHEGEYRLVTGNQLCALLADYMFSRRQALGTMPPKPGMVTTIVTSPLVPTLAAHYGVACPLVLTGFKWIAEIMRRWANGTDGAYSFLYGTEESYGYLIGTHCRDKDGIVAACVTTEMAAWHREQGRSLIDALHRIWGRHGVHIEWQKSVYHEGADGARRIQAIIQGLKEKPPRQIGSYAVEKITRVDTGEILDAATGKCIGRVDLPKSDVIIFDLSGGAQVIARPSGTEPKIKFYFFLRETEPPAGEDATAAEIQGRYQRLSQSRQEFQAAFLREVGE